MPAPHGPRRLLARHCTAPGSPSATRAHTHITPPQKRLFATNQLAFFFDTLFAFCLFRNNQASFDKISAVIADLKVKGSAKGVSRTAIKTALGDVSAARVNMSLKKAVAAGKLIQVKESFKLPKPVAAPKPKKKKAAPKKKPAKKATKKKSTKKKPAAKKKSAKKPAKKAKKKSTKKKSKK